MGGMHLKRGGYVVPSSLFTESLFAERGIDWRSRRAAGRRGIPHAFRRYRCDHAAGRGTAARAGTRTPKQSQDGEEGCLSFPGICYDVKRRLNTVARGFTDRGDPVQVVGTEVMARCLQHETDHLDGVLFNDRMDAATRKLAMKFRASKWHMQMKMSRHRKTGRIL